MNLHVCFQVASTLVAKVAGVLCILVSFCPKIVALLVMIPDSIGGAVLAVCFGEDSIQSCTCACIHVYIISFV